MPVSGWMSGLVVEGLGKTRWEGRLEVLQRAPMLLVDGAHNPAGAATLRRALQKGFSPPPADPDLRCPRTIRITGRWSRGSFPWPTGLSSPGRTASGPCPWTFCCRWPGGSIGTLSSCENPGDALRSALSLAGKEDLVCVAGSLYLVGEIKKIHQAGGGRMPSPGSGRDERCRVMLRRKGVCCVALVLFFFLTAVSARRGAGEGYPRGTGHHRSGQHRL